MNNLFDALAQVLRKQRPSASNIVPFSIGRIYNCAYRNWHHDPKPLLLILGSDAFYTVAININYLGVWKQSLMTQILYFRQSNRVLTGRIVYNVIKQRTPMIPKIGFRKYFTSMLRGKLVSEGISQIPELNKNQWITNPWAQQLNRLIHPQVANKTVYNPQKSQQFRDQVVYTQYSQNSQKPFANKTIVQYNPQQEMPGITIPEGSQNGV